MLIPPFLTNDLIPFDIIHYLTIQDVLLLFNILTIVVEMVFLLLEVKMTLMRLFL